MDDVTIPRAAWEWLSSGDTGLSSETIWHVMTGLALPRAHWFPSTPLDSGDFGRCHRLLERIPEWRDRLPEVAARYPEWTGLVREWTALSTLYADALAVKADPYRRMFEPLQRLRDEGLRAAGWRQTSPNGWEGPLQAGAR